MMGNLALKELNSTHIGIHAILGLIDVNFTREELSCIQHYLKTTTIEPPLGSTGIVVNVIRKVEAVLSK